MSYLSWIKATHKEAVDSEATAGRSCLLGRGEGVEEARVRPLRGLLLGGCWSQELLFLVREGVLLHQHPSQVVRVLVPPLYGVVGDQEVPVQVLGVLVPPVHDMSDRDPLIGPIEDDRNLPFAEHSLWSHLVVPTDGEIALSKASVVQGDV